MEEYHIFTFGCGQENAHKYVKIEVLNGDKNQVMFGDMDLSQEILANYKNRKNITENIK